jgi:hypothetical protein
MSANRIEDRIHWDERQHRSWLAAEVRFDPLFERSDGFVSASELRVDCGVSNGLITRYSALRPPNAARPEPRSHLGVTNQPYVRRNSNSN